MATLVVQQTAIRHSRSPPPLSSALTLDTSKFQSAPIPNKRLPYCSPGPTPSSLGRAPATPPASPTPTKKTITEPSSTLYPADRFPKIVDSPPIYSIEAADLAEALEEAATQPLPDPKLVFPWLHGLHPENQIQLAFFVGRRKALRKAPKGIRNITIVKAGGDLSKAKLKGALAPNELLSPMISRDPTFHDADPRDGFSVRNFHIQPAKMAMVSDIVVYGDENAKREDILSLAKRIARAQNTYRQKFDGGSPGSLVYHTFVVSSPFSDFESNHSDIVAINSSKKSTGKVMDFFQWERQEMCAMSKASEIAHNVWLGPTPDTTICPSSTDGHTQDFDVLIEASDLARSPDSKTLKRIAEMSISCPQLMDFPSSGSIMPPTWSHAEVDSLLETCQWIHKLANPDVTPASSDESEQDNDGDIPMKTFLPRARRILIHCADGYTESSLLALTYFMYAECIPVHEAWLRMHCEKKRNFFAYHSDVALLSTIQPRILQESPQSNGGIPSSLPEDPEWLKRIDGSLPSRILPHMYLGNLGHANNPELLKAMGIKRVLSVGEPVNWSPEIVDSWGKDRLLFVDRVQDNGVDPLTDEFDRCLEFIRKGHEEGTATLVHCRVGVSRSATICIAEVMASLGLSFPRAYCFVRARRLNVIIQPHLRFTYELLKWEELQQLNRGQAIRRELEWATIAREIAAMNKPYTK